MNLQLLRHRLFFEPKQRNFQIYLFIFFSDALKKKEEKKKKCFVVNKNVSTIMLKQFDCAV